MLLRFIEATETLTLRIRKMHFYSLVTKRLFTLAYMTLTCVMFYLGEFR